MKPSRLPPDIRSEINRLAHAQAQIHEIEQRQRMQTDALAQIRAGRPVEDILFGLVDDTGGLGRFGAKK